MLTELKRYSCTTCGAPLNEKDGQFICPNCKNVYRLEEKISEEEVIALNRATTDRNLLRFDDAFEEYDLLLKKYPKNEMANWGAFLSFYGIVYEQDVDGKYIPTCHRLSEKPVESSKYYRCFNDEHKRRAEEIEKLRASIMQKAQRIPPYDVFICYKATEERFGRPYPTKESSWARDVYEMLTHELNLRVFFAEKTLGDSNEEYESHIYSALNSAKLMFVMTTGMENVNAVWVKNEWKRYSKYIQDGQDKTIRVVYDNIEPYDLPLELQKRQAINHNDMDWGAKVKKAAEAIFIDPLEKERKKKEQEEAARKAREAAEAKERAREEELQKMRETMEALKRQANAPKPAPAPTPTVSAPVRRGEPADKYCVKCGAGNVSSAKFCAECAHNVFAPEFKKYCWECGTETDLLKKFCPHCAKNSFTYDKATYAKEIERRKLADFEIEYGVLKRYKGNDKKVIIPNSVKSIGDFAFQNRTGLTSVIIPDGVTNIGNSAFKGCSNLLGITVGENNTAYKSINGNLYSKDGTALLQYAVGRTDEAFTIPDGVTSIGSSAFEGCGSLTDITIPSSVTSIGEDVFKGCDNLKTVECPAIVCKQLPKKSLQTVTVTGGSIEEKALEECRGLTLATLLDGVTSIGDSAFSFCKNLMSITVPDSVTTIGKYAFAACDSLTDITIPSGVTAIGERAFNGCSGLTNIEVSENNAVYKSVNGDIYSKDGTTFVQYAVGKADMGFTIPEGVTSIDNGAFAWGENLKNIVIPDGVVSIGDSVFEDCLNLTDITVPDSVVSIGDSAFNCCRNLTSAVLPDGLTSIGNTMFRECGSLTNIHIPDSVTSIGVAAFFVCENLTNVNIPDGVKSIGYNAFCRCGHLTEINLPDSVESIGFSAFGSCRSLKSIRIPDGVTDIEGETFYACNSLTDIAIPNSVTYIGKDAFKGCDNLKRVECSMYAYRNLPTQSLQTVTITDGDIADRAFEGCVNLTSITLLDGVKSIGASAFKGCSSLTDIAIPNSVTKMGRYAFV